jgi:hypothetical protein
MIYKKKPVGDSGGLFLYVLSKAGLAAKDRTLFFMIMKSSNDFY